MIMAQSLIKIVGVGVLEAVPCDSISLYEYRKIHQTEIIKWSRWGLLCGWGIKRLEMMSPPWGGRADQNHSPGEGGQCRTLCCCCPLHAQLAFVEVRNSAPPSHTPLQSPPNLACLPSASASWNPRKMTGKNQCWAEEKLPSSLIPSFHTLIIFNTTWQLFVFSLNPF